ncbi:retrovirus-related pol polyprotein from transposon TNT 1-94 [Tanacetum coccineum]
MKTFIIWIIDELSSKLIQEEARLKKQRVHSVNLLNQGVDKKLKPKAKNFKKKQHAKTSKAANGEKKEQHNNKCKFCKKEGHFQKDCPKNKAWFEKKDTPQQNGVAERRNKTLMEMVRNKISKSSLPKSLWIYALRTAVYLLNRVPSKSVPKTHFDLWTGRKSSLRHLHAYGCPTKARVYCPNHSYRIVEADNAKFPEKGKVSGSVENKVLDINEIRDDDLLMNYHKSITTPNVVLEFNNQEE